MNEHPAAVSRLTAAGPADQPQFLWLRFFRQEVL